MTSEHSATSSDLELARALSRRLETRAAPAERRAGERSPAPVGAPPAAAPFVRFRAAVVAPAAPVLLPRAESPTELPPGLDPNLTGGALWNQLLDWCRAAAQAETAFAMDAWGLVVGSRGPLLGEEFEEIGARLIVILDQAKEMQRGEAASFEPAVGVEIGPSWLTGFQVPLDDGSPLTIGLIGKEAVAERVRSALKRVVRARLAASG